MPRYSAGDKERLVEFLFEMRKDAIVAFLRQQGVPHAGTKEQLRETVEEELESGTIRYAALVAFLDEREPWGKQHIFLYDGPANGVVQWRDEDWFLEQADEHGFLRLVNSSATAVLPRQLRLVSVTHNPSCLRVSAVARREGWSRAPEHDESRGLGHGRELLLRGYLHEVARNIVAFEWDLETNTAMLQVTQLPSGVAYETVRDEFRELVEAWLDLSRFAGIDLRQAIRRLHALEEGGGDEVRSHGIDYETEAGRRFNARGGSTDTPLLGEPVTDDALRRLRGVSSGRIGNLYWLPQAGTPIGKQVHVYLIASKGRINITMPQPEEVTRHVVERIREHSKQAPAAP